MHYLHDVHGMIACRADHVYLSVSPSTGFNQRHWKNFDKVLSVHDAITGYHKLIIFSVL
jgi:hypothetical protein